MSQQLVDSIARAIYDSAHLADTDDIQTIVLSYRDAINWHDLLRTSHRDFVAFCTGQSAFTDEPEDDVVSSTFAAARNALNSEQLASLSPAENIRHLDQHLRKISHASATELLTQLEQQLEQGRIGELRRIGDNMARCTLPQYARGNQPPPFALMKDSLDPAAEVPSTTSIDLFINHDELLIDDQRRVRRLPPVQQLLDRSTLPLEEFLRIVIGTPYRSENQLAEGEFGAVTLGHYVIESWSDENVTTTPPREASTHPHLNVILLAATFALLLLLGVGVVAAITTSLRPSEHSQLPKLQEAPISSSEESTPVPATPDPPPAADSPLLLSIKESQEQLMASVRLLKDNIDRIDKNNTSLSRKLLSNTQQDETNELLKTVTALSSRVDEITANSASPVPTQSRNELATTPPKTSKSVSPEELAKAVDLAMRSGTSLPPLLEKRFGPIRDFFGDGPKHPDDPAQREKMEEITKEAKRFCNDLNIDVSGVFDAFTETAGR